MAERESRIQGRRESIKGPLAFSAVIGVIAGVLTLIFATAGPDNGVRWDLGAIGFAIAFIVCLVFSALLLMTEKPNDPKLSAGSGINRSVAKIPGGAASVPAPGSAESHAAVRRAEEAERQRAEADGESRDGSAPKA